MRAAPPMQPLSPPQLSKSRAKNASKPAAARGVSAIKKNARRTNYAVGAEAQRVRPDLKVSSDD